MIEQVFKDAYEKHFRLNTEDPFSHGLNLTVLNSIYFACVSKYGNQEGSFLFDRCKSGMDAMGYGDFYDLPAGDVRQSARLLWIMWCELMAKEQGV